MSLEYEHHTEVRADRSGQSRIVEVDGLESSQVAKRDFNIPGSVEGASDFVRNRNKDTRAAVKDTVKIAD